MMRKGLIALLEKKGFHFILDAADGAEFLALLDNASEQPDVCMIDLSMPVMDGFELISRLREKGHYRILVLTAYDTEFNIMKIIHLNVNGYVQKSSSPNTLELAIRSVFDYGYFFPDAQGETFLKAVQQGRGRMLELNEREIEVLKKLCSDKTYQEIAEEMGTTRRTVDGIKDRLLVKFNVKNRPGLMMVALNSGMIND